FALLPGSPAIDAGASGGIPAQDQRGINRLGAVDIGAFESRGFTLSITGGNHQQAIVGTAFASSLGVQGTSAFGGPVQGGAGIFTAPAGGASATLADGATATLDGTGQASLSVAANGTSGDYSVTAAATGVTRVTFSLINLAPISLTAALPD